MDITKTIQDAAYVTVGVGVQAFQQAQVRRREAQAALPVQLEKAKTTVSRQAQDVKDTAVAFSTEVRERVEPFVGDVKGRVEPLVEQLQTVPAQVMQAVEAGAARARDLVGRAA
ncbi:MAG TPA: hypothetical protein VF152_04970 [Acidimicrobiia bacterium]